MVELLKRAKGLVTAKGFTMIEVLVSLTVLAVGILVLGGLLVRASRTAEAASTVSYQTADMTTEVARLSALPFNSLVAGTTCDTTTGPPFPRIRCSTITNSSVKVRLVKVKVSPDNPLMQADSVMFERSKSTETTPLNTP